MNQKQAVSSLTSGYVTGKQGYDEMWGTDGRIRTHWQIIYSRIQQMGGAELKQRQQEVQRMLRENGVTYNVYGDPNGLNRPWKLDFIPLVVNQEDWARIEAGLIQRAEVLNLILADLYGPRQLIKNGLLPPELIYSHKGFLRPCDQTMQSGKPLILYAADLARGPDGRMWVVNDRTQAPSGMGYALENRTAMVRVLPDLYQDCQVRKIAGFFNQFHQALVALAPYRKSNPRIVLMTPGPRNETYFEHAYLASYLGYNLVQGEDLVVRDGCVWLKSLHGLEQVDILLRRVDDHFCDPLELREDSQLGVAGLLEAVRMGNVVVANPMGSSVLENPGLMAFLPGITRYFLNQDLLLPSMATWWCGQPRELRYVLDNLDKLIIKTIDQRSRTVFGSTLSSQELQALRQQIRDQPHWYLGQEHVSFSTSPSLVEGDLEPRFSVMRNFLVAQPDGYVVMPGGLTRSAPEKDNFFVSNQTGGISKDTWVLSPEPEAPLTIRFKSELPTTFTGVLPSRTAENLFWVGRYARRALSTARLLRTVLRNLNESQTFAQEADEQCLRNLLYAVTHLTMTYPGFVGKGSDKHLKNPESELLSVTLDANRNGGLSATLELLIQAIYVSRDPWSTDTWRIVDGMREQWNILRALKSPNLRKVQSGLDQLITDLLAFKGLNTESMTSEQGRLMYDTGRRIEQGILQASLVRSTLMFQQDEPVEYPLLEALLSGCESLNTYRYRYRSHLQTQAVIDLLLLDTTYPRSVAYQLAQLQIHLAGLPKSYASNRLSEEERLVWEAFTALGLSDAGQLLRPNEKTGMREELDALLAKMGSLLARTATVITQKFFNHSQTPHSLTSVRQIPDL